MCGRYAFYEHQELSARLISLVLDTSLFDHFRPTWNAAPSQSLPVIVEDDGAAVVREMRWGLIPRWTKPGQSPKVTPINARAETLGEKPMFRSLIKDRRCVIPANGFYEWRGAKGDKQPWFIHPADGQLMLFAGLYDEARGIDDEPLESYAIITTNANGPMSQLHDRMPVILDANDVSAWLDRDMTEAEPLEHLLRPADDDAIEMHPVTRAVNNTRHNDPSLIEPLDDEEGQDQSNS
jgi:putative SOS response-associated peptidase YedK